MPVYMKISKEKMLAANKIIKKVVQVVLKLNISPIPKAIMIGICSPPTQL